MMAKWISGVTVLLAGMLALTGCESSSESVKTPVAAPARTAAPTATAPAAGGSGRNTVLRSPKEIESYSLGVETVRNYKKQKMDVDVDLMIQGMKDATAGNQLLVSEADIQNAMIMVMGEARQRAANARLNAGEDNKKEGEAFLATNKAKEGVVTLPDGLQYNILTQGTGPKPTDADTVHVNYRGTLIDGTEFDSNRVIKKPAILNLGDLSLIAGWREALKLMPEGSKWQIFIPSQLAYGAKGYGRFIGPYATIIFEVELLKVEKKTTASAPASGD